MVDAGVPSERLYDLIIGRDFFVGHQSAAVEELTILYQTLCST